MIKGSGVGGGGWRWNGHIQSGDPKSKRKTNKTKEKQKNKITEIKIGFLTHNTKLNKYLPLRTKKKSGSLLVY